MGWQAAVATHYCVPRRDSDSDSDSDSESQSDSKSDQNELPAWPGSSPGAGRPAPHEPARMTQKGNEYWQSITVWLHACSVPSPSRAMLHGPHCPSKSCRSANNRPREATRVTWNDPSARGKTPEPSLQPRSRGWPRPLVVQGPDWTVPHLYAPCYTARYLMFCQSSQTKSFAAALAHQISHRNTVFSPPSPQWFRGMRCRRGRGRLLESQLPC